MELYLRCLYVLYLHGMYSKNCSVAVATRYGLDGPGIEFRWGEIFRTRPD